MGVLGAKGIRRNLIESSEFDFMGYLVEVAVEHMASASSSGRARVSRLLPDFRQEVRRGRRSFDERKAIVLESYDDDLIHDGGIDFVIEDAFEFTGDTKKFDLNNSRAIEQAREDGLLRKLGLNANGKIVLDASPSGKKVYALTMREKIFVNGFSYLVDSKSGRGRIGIFCHDFTRCGREGEGLSNFLNRVSVATTPLAFPIEFEPGKTSAFQALFRYEGSPFMSRQEVLKSNGNIGLRVDDRELPLSNFRNLTRGGRLVTRYDTRTVYRAKPISEIPGPIDLDAPEEMYDSRDYFDLIETNGMDFEIVPERLHLLATLESLVLNGACGLLSRMHKITGDDVLHHLEGFGQPGFNGTLTTETYSFREGVVLGHGQTPVYYIDLDKFEGGEGTYAISGSGGFQGQSQGPRLPKVFQKV